MEKVTLVCVDCGRKIRSYADDIQSNDVYRVCDGDALEEEEEEEEQSTPILQFSQLHKLLLLPQKN